MSFQPTNLNFQKGKDLSSPVCDYLSYSSAIFYCYNQIFLEKLSVPCLVKSLLVAGRQDDIWWLWK